MYMYAVLTSWLRQSVYLGLKHIATFDIFVVIGSSSLKHNVERGFHIDVCDCAVIAG